MAKFESQLICLIALGFSLNFFTSNANAEESNYEFRQIRIEDGSRETVRFNVKTGESWYNWTTTQPIWSRVPETSGTPPAGNYDVMLLPGITKDTAWTLRVDKISGKAWNFGANGWEEFKEPAAEQPQKK